LASPFRWSSCREVTCHDAALVIQDADERKEEDRRLNIRISTKDLEAIQKRARALIASL